MKSWERMVLPHAVYRVFDATGVLLYIGCSQRIGARLAVHGNTQPWYHEIARIEVEWHPNEPHAKVAEAKAIENEKPKYNRLIADPQKIAEEPKPARGDGVHCPKCGGEKESQKMAYCRACMRTYQQDRRRLLLGS